MKRIWLLAFIALAAEAALFLGAAHADARHDLPDWYFGLAASDTNAELYAGYRYVDAIDLKEENFNTVPGLEVPFEHKTHSVEVGIRFFF